MGLKGWCKSLAAAPFRVLALGQGMEATPWRGVITNSAQKCRRRQAVVDRRMGVVMGMGRTCIARTLSTNIAAVTTTGAVLVGSPRAMATLHGPICMIGYRAQKLAHCLLRRQRQLPHRHWLRRHHRLLLT